MTERKRSKFFKKSNKKQANVPHKKYIRRKSNKKVVFDSKIKYFTITL